jgi:hypothetical protein
MICGVLLEVLKFINVTLLILLLENIILDKNVIVAVNCKMKPTEGLRIDPEAFLYFLEYNAGLTNKTVDWPVKRR